MTLITAVLSTVLTVAIVHMEPILTSMATARVSKTVNRIVVEAVSDAIQGGEIDYGVLVEFEKDAAGRDMAVMVCLDEANSYSVVAKGKELQTSSPYPGLLCITVKADKKPVTVNIKPQK